MSDAFAVVMAGYQAVEPAKKDFDGLVQLVKDKKVKSEGVILVEHDESGEVTRRADRRPPRPQGHGLGRRRRRARRPGRAAAAGRDRRRRRRRRHRRQVRQAQGRQRPRERARREAQAGHGRHHRHRRRRRPARGRAGARRLAGQVGRADGQARPPRPQGRARRGGRQVRPRPHRAADPRQDVRRHGRPHAQGLGRRLVDHPRAQGARGRAQRARSSSSTTPASASIDTFGGPVSTPAFTPRAGHGPDLQPLPRDGRLLADARGAAHRAQPAPRRLRLHRRVSRAPSPATRPASPRSCAAFPRILKENGYVTGGFGKWHLTPDNVQGAAGPFDHWPKSWGFDHWWGFLSGAAGQYDPIITQDDWTLGVPEGKDGKPYYFPDDITDKAIEWLHAVRAQDAHKPWMMFYSTGCAHAPHHVATEWADKYKGKFDDGWDALRERTLARQKQLGIVPQDTELTERPDVFPAWDSLTDDAEEALRAPDGGLLRVTQENADWNVGRLLDSIEEMGDLDNTLDHLHLGRQRRQHGGHDHRLVQRDDVPQRHRARRRAAARADRAVRRHRGARRRPHRAAHRGRLGARLQHPVPVGQADRPATSAAPATRWSSRGRAGIKADKAMRAQFTHVHRRRPDHPRGGRHPRAEGRSTASSRSRWTAPASCTRSTTPQAPERHTDAVLRDVRRPRHVQGRLVGGLAARPPPVGPLARRRSRSSGPDADWDPDRDVGWELYDLTTDFSQAHDVAAEHPDKVAELQELWWQEAERNRVLPLMGGLSVIYGILPPLPTVTRFELRRRRAERPARHDRRASRAARTRSRPS